MRERSWGLSKYLWRLGGRGGEGEGRMGRGEGRRVGLELELAEGGREEGEVVEARGGGGRGCHNCGANVAPRYRTFFDIELS